MIKRVAQSEIDIANKKIDSLQECFEKFSVNEYNGDFKLNPDKSLEYNYLEYIKINRI